MATGLVWIQFIACLSIIAVASSRLAEYSDLVAKKTGLGRVWIGVVLLATITSLPELATGISSVAVVGQPDLTMGDLFGSNLLNLVIIAVIDLVHRGGPVLHYLGTGIVLSAVLSSMLIAAAATSLYLAQNLSTAPVFGRVELYSVSLLVLYALTQYMIFRFRLVEGGGQSERSTVSSPDNSPSLRRAVAFFAVAAMATAGAGIWLANIGNHISETTGLSTSFVGTLFLTISTSAPEIMVSISAARLGALEMAVGNVVGSNLLNMGVVIFVIDIFYANGSVFQGAAMSHLVTALFAILMSCVVIIGIIFRPRFWLPIWVGMDSAALLVFYLGAIIAVYFLGRPG